jgi:hypothetical protein
VAPEDVIRILCIRILASDILRANPESAVIVKDCTCPDREKVITFLLEHVRTAKSLDLVAIEHESFSLVSIPADVVVIVILDSDTLPGCIGWNPFVCSSNMLKTRGNRRVSSYFLYRKGKDMFRRSLRSVSRYAGPSHESGTLRIDDGIFNSSN